MNEAAQTRPDTMNKLRSVKAYLETTLRTNSKDTADWRDDVELAVSMINVAIAAPQAGAVGVVEPTALQPITEEYLLAVRAESGYDMSQYELLREGVRLAERVHAAAPQPAASQVQLLEQFTKGYELGLKQVDRPQPAAPSEG